MMIDRYQGFPPTGDSKCVVQRRNNSFDRVRPLEVDIRISTNRAPFDPSFIFSPYALLLGLVLDDNAFGARSLTTAEALSKIYVEPGRNQREVVINPEKGDIPVFHRAVAITEGWVISSSLRMTYKYLYDSMKELGRLAQFKDIYRPYVL
jgi:Protein of unknown function (DUF3435)